MPLTNHFIRTMSDEATWEFLQILLQEYSPDIAEQHKEYLIALDQLSAIGCDTVSLDKAYRSAIVSDALFAFQKGLEANLFHFQHPYVPSFIPVDYENLYQECVMSHMPKRVIAEKTIHTIEAASVQADFHQQELIREYIVDLEVVVPKLMHFAGYLAGNSWFSATVPGYQEDHALTSCYHMEIQKYFG